VGLYLVLLKINGMLTAAARKKCNLIKIVPMWKLNVRVCIHKVPEPGNNNLCHAAVSSKQVANAVCGHFFCHKWVVLMELGCYLIEKREK
jgi:hypothetical protein